MGIVWGFEKPPLTRLQHVASNGCVKAVVAVVAAVAAVVAVVAAAGGLGVFPYTPQI